MTTARRHLEIDGCRLEVSIVAAPERAAPTLVFLHEGLGSLGQWRSFPARLASAVGCRALVYSRAGYGRSAPPPRPRDLDYLDREALTELPALLEATQVADPILVGHSDGATIALIYAAAGLPVRGIVAMAPHVLVEELTLAGIRATGSAWAATDLRTRLARWHDDPEGVFRRWYDVWLDPRFRGWNIVGRLPAIRCPLLLVQGREDEYGSLAQLEAIAGATGGPVETRVLSPCGHVPWKEHPEEVQAACVPFIAALTSGLSAPVTARAPDGSPPRR